MAVLPKGQQAGRTSMSDAQDRDTPGSSKSKDVIIDLSNPEMLKSLPRGEKVKIDPNEDAWAFSAPPAKGDYDIKVMPAKDFVVLRKTDSGDDYYSLAMECPVLDKDGNKIATVFPRVSTLMGRGKSISTAAGLIGKLGFKIPEEGDHYSIMMMCAKAIKSEKIAKVLLDWQGGYKDGKGDYKTPYRTMTDFPFDNETKEYIHIVSYRPKRDEPPIEIRAMLNVAHWYSKGEESKVAARSKKVVAEQTIIELAEEISEIEETKTESNGTNGTTKLSASGGKPEPAKMNDDELEELLEA